MERTALFATVMLLALGVSRSVVVTASIPNAKGVAQVELSDKQVLKVCEYQKKRDAERWEHEKHSINRYLPNKKFNVEFRHKEKLVNAYMEQLKRQEFCNTMFGKDKSSWYQYLPAMSFLRNKDAVFSSPVYQHLRTFPKGANLHVHLGQMTSMKWLIDEACKMDADNSSPSERLSCCNSGSLDLQACQVSFRTEHCVSFSSTTHNFSCEAVSSIVEQKKAPNCNDFLMSKFVLNADDVPETRTSDYRWKVFDAKTGANRVVKYWPLLKRYFEHALEVAVNESVSFIEMRGSMESYYVLDPNVRNDKYCGISFPVSKTAPVELKANASAALLMELKNVSDSFMLRFPDVFLGTKFIVQVKRLPEGNLSGTFRSAADGLAVTDYFLRSSNDELSNYVVGFDLVGPEDNGLALKYFDRTFEKMYSEFKKKGDVTLSWKSKPSGYFHSGETSWPIDLVTSMSSGVGLSAMENLYDAKLLATRIGHGLSLYKVPHLLKKIKDEKIPVEVNPVSNQVLGYTPDLRNHPAINYMNDGVKVVIGSDDPGGFGYSELTLDYYYAYSNWGLNISGLLRLAMNTADAMAAKSAEKRLVRRVIEQQYMEFVEEVFSKIPDLRLTASTSSPESCIRHRGIDPLVAVSTSCWNKEYPLPFVVQHPALNLTDMTTPVECVFYEKGNLKYRGKAIVYSLTRVECQRGPKKRGIYELQVEVNHNATVETIIDDFIVGDPQCLSLSSLVQTAQKGEIPLGDLRVGDTVYSVNDSGHVIEDYVYAISHSSETTVTVFVEIRYNCGNELRSVRLTRNHFLPVNTSQNMVKAIDVRPGDRLLANCTCGGDAEVVGSSLVLEEGFINPLTFSGKIFVDGVLVSTYSAEIPWTLTHLFLSPLRWLYTAASGMGCDPSWNVLNNGYAWFMQPVQWLWSAWIGASYMHNALMEVSSFPCFLV